ncbi:hypothetical protein ACKI14_45025 [Streptomyces turgidiscabies]|uniref:hypothetical protein n=1 Tax=Streptomyces turgidiscabies TaxID=85558 RepID=UPI0038F63253
MRTTSKVTVTLAHFLFVSQAPAAEFVKAPERALELIHTTSNQLGPDAAHKAAAEVAFEYGRHPETAAAHMRVCLRAVASSPITISAPLQRTAVTR